MSEHLKRSCVRSYVDEEKILQLRMDLSGKNYENMGELLGVFSNPTRLKILDSLSKTDELCVCDLADILDMDVSAISHQLRKLKDRGFVAKRRDGLTIYYRLSLAEHSIEACHFIESKIANKFERIK